MPASPQDVKVLGVLAGAGEYPRLMIEGARRAGIPVVAAGFKGAVDKGIAALCDDFRTFRVGAVEGPRDFFVSHGVTHVVLTGQIKPACIYTMWPDATARRLLSQLDRRNAHTIFGAVCGYVAEQGMEVLPSTTFMEHCMPAAGYLAGPAPTPEQMDEARYGMETAREIARLDIGQSVIVHGRDLVCIEAYKGTNECLRAGGGKPYPVTLCKVTKPGHDMRFDVPCIGLGTIRNCLKMNVRHIVIEAKRTIVFQQGEVLRLCNENGITLQAMDLPAGGICLAEPPAEPDDAAHALFLARELEKLGAGHSAVVCEGVVIAVEDPEGPLKCVRRAAAYMKRIRFARFTNWLCRVLLGRAGTPPAPMTLASTVPLPPEALEAARRASFHLAE